MKRNKANKYKDGMRDGYKLTNYLHHDERRPARVNAASAASKPVEVGDAELPLTGWRKDAAARERAKRKGRTWQSNASFQG